ncbi:MAG: hypothetical protein NTV05_16650 [Acidobacteria bacterium]|nr:hypothetical protein [Acidobacteriota bacterium]
MKVRAFFWSLLVVGVSCAGPGIAAADDGWMQQGVRVWYLGAVDGGGVISSNAEETYRFDSIVGTNAQVVHHSALTNWTSPLPADTTTYSLLDQGPCWMPPQTLQTIAPGDYWQKTNEVITWVERTSYTYSTFVNNVLPAKVHFLPIKALFDLKPTRQIVKVVYRIDLFSTGVAHFDAETGIVLYQNQVWGGSKMFFVLAEINYDFARQTVVAEDGGPHTGFKSTVVEASLGRNWVGGGSVVFQSLVESRYGSNVETRVQWSWTAQVGGGMGDENYCFFGDVPLVTRMDATLAPNSLPEQWNPFGQYLWWWLPPAAMGLQADTAVGTQADAAVQNINVFNVPMEKTSDAPLTYVATQTPAAFYFSTLWFDGNGYMTAFAAKGPGGFDVKPGDDAFENHTTVNGRDYYLANMAPPAPPAVTTNAATNVGQGSAQLSATVNPKGLSTTLYFDHGPTTSYGNTATYGVIGSGAVDVTQTYTLSGLSCGTSYQYRARVQSSAGTTNGASQPFTTLACTATPVITWATPEPVKAGTALSATQLNATATVNGNPVPGTFVFTPPTGTAMNTTGTQTLSVTFTPTDAATYATVTKTVDLVVQPVPTLAVTPATLRFTGTNTGGTLNPLTGPQMATVIFSNSPALAWTAVADQPWVQITHGAGTGSGTFTVGIINPDNVLGAATSASATVTVTAAGASNSPQAVAVTLTLQPASANQPPFGAFDTPGDGTTGMQGSFAVTGWALDDVAIDRVEIWRDLVLGEDGSHAYTTDPAHPAHGKVFIANPLFVTDARPDVEGIYAGYPFANRAGWGYLLLSWGLEGQGNGPYTLYAFAFDVDGHWTSLGSKAIAVDNAHASKPFGSIDTPGYGETRSGTFVNFGWALTPAGDASCRIDNGHVWVTVDSLPAALVSYGDARADIAASFPGFLNSANASGAYYVNTTTLTNGRHQIGWLVYDSCGRGDGIGSRFFNVLNGGADAGASRLEAGPEPGDPRLATVPDAAPRGTTPPAEPVGVSALARSAAAGPRRSSGSEVGEPTSQRSTVGGRRAGVPLGSPGSSPARLRSARDDNQSPLVGPVSVRQLGGEWEDLPADAEGGHLIDVMQGDRIEVQLPRAASGGYLGHLAVDAERRPLPVGSSLDATAGVFYWQPAPAFLGAFDLVFEAPGTDAVRVRVVVK